MKELLIFLAGLGVGSAGTYFVLKGHFEEELEAEVSEFMDYKREQKKTSKKARKRITEESEEQENEEPEESEETSDEEDRESYAKIVKANYSKPSPEEVKKEKKKRKKNDPAKIFLLSPKAFASSEFDKPTVYLYGDGVVVDDDENIIDNGYALLGGNDVIKEAENTGETTVYIRNMNNSTDYEVIMCSEDYGTIEVEETGPEDG